MGGWGKSKIQVKREQVQNGDGMRRMEGKELEGRGERRGDHKSPKMTMLPVNYNISIRSNGINGVIQLLHFIL